MRFPSPPRLANDHVFPKLIGRACEAAGLKIKPHPTCFDKFALANADKDTRSLQVCLGQKNIQQTVKYTESVPSRFKGGGKINVFPTL